MKKRLTKRILSVVICWMIVLSCIPMTVLANENGVCGDNAEWEFHASSGTLKITGTGSMYDYDFMSNEAPWERFCNEIISVEIGNGITHLGEDAFFGCENLADILVPASVASIGKGIFTQCYKLKNVDFSATSIATIPEMAFNQCFELETVSFPQGLTSIGKSAFYYCNSLEKLILPTTVTFIDDYAFKYTYDGWKLYVTGNAPTLGEGVFIGSYAKIQAPDVYVYGTTATGYDVVDENDVKVWGDDIYYVNQINSRNIYVQGMNTGLGMGVPIIDGKAEPVVKVYDYTDEKLLVEGVDYTISFSNNATPSDYHTDNYAVVTVTGMGEYGGMVSEEFLAMEGGKCGENAVWIIDEEYLYIWGSGEMYDYSEEEPAPWAERVEDIKSVSVEGVSRIGENTFADLTNLERVYIEKTVMEVGREAFSNCTALSEILFESSAPSVANDIFFGAKDGIYIVVLGKDSLGYEGNPWDEQVVIYVEKIVESDVTLDADYYYYTGEEIKPIVTVSKAILGELTEGIHYIVAYSDNIEVGTGIVTITGLEGFEGPVVTVEFEIIDENDETSGTEEEKDDEIPGTEEEKDDEIPGTEEEKDDEIPGIEDEKDNEISGTDAPNTGDYSNVFLWMSVALVSVMTCTFLLVKKRKR